MTDYNKTRSDEISSAFYLTVRPDNVAVITMNVPGEKVNTLKAEFAAQFEAILREARQISGLRGMVIISGKPGNFIAGADINMIASCQDAAQAQALSAAGQQLFNLIENYPLPIIAAIHGSCLGGGLELAMACHSRIVTDSDKTRLGLPEVQLGLLPGSGGTQRLPGLTGLITALDMMLTGRQLRAKQAFKLRLADDIVPEDILLETAAARALSAHPARRAPESLWQKTQRMKGVRHIILRITRKKTQRLTHGHYPAAEQIINVVQCGLDKGRRAGFQAESAAFGKLAVTAASGALRHIFFAASKLKKDGAGDVKPAELHHVAVLGGGLMGAGIAAVTRQRAGLPVRIKDISQDGVSKALAFFWQHLSKQVKQRRLSPRERTQLMGGMTGTTDYRGFHRIDFVTEAVFESLALKQQMVAEIQSVTQPETIFATNTSSLPVCDIAENALRPEKIIGLHYFSPVEKMPLAEIIPHAGTDAVTLATTLQLARRQGKTTIVVGDKPGFYVNRILAPYITEALRCLIEGEPVEKIDNALTDFGFPLGPVALLDEVGIDVGTKIMPVLEAEFGERFALPVQLQAIFQDNRLGKKNGRGFYDYSPLPLWRRFGRKAPRKADKQIYDLLGSAAQGQLTAQAIAERCVMMMLNEAVRVLDEQVIRSPADGDIGAVFGIGFPPFLGGPFYYMDTLSPQVVAERLTALAALYGDRFTPCEALMRRAEENLRFF
ncbi:fatty acid oxidation complex subunit alpha FadJ [Morganella psychrotolerans]|uniref:enoyl-CoA hydratase n=1 Tax=Morganella psychrotolerans TaxID=368603 RepID=A0A5M9R740_9GAMM|nr:fatty acid oxidation complex subunit alpha FadJ [Morganella psychrotolerans]KAA8716774.1 fatty acid oxidation complex subunit alpha FadJ [Morganella psychrotolerans]OBU08871.1 multifunctional fatty acid oxidation complex subunit alpha [Morganella psychrotolerans]